MGEERDGEKVEGGEEFLGRWGERSGEKRRGEKKEGDGRQELFFGGTSSSRRNYNINWKESPEGK